MLTKPGGQPVTASARYSQDLYCQRPTTYYYHGTHRSRSCRQGGTPCPLFLDVVPNNVCSQLYQSKGNIGTCLAQTSETRKRATFTVALPSSARVALRVFLVLPHSCRRPDQRRVFLFVSNHSTTNRHTQ